MAVELCPETTGWPWQPVPVAGSSPRISFSRDLSDHQSGEEGSRLDGSLLFRSPATSDFDFCVAGESEHSTADELFSDGKLLPIPIQPRTQNQPTAQPPNWVPPTPPPPPPPPSAVGDSAGELERHTGASQKPPSSFWKFGRSNSLNCHGDGDASNSGGGNYKASFICSMALLNRSKSTGSSTPISPQLKNQSKGSFGPKKSAAKVMRSNSNSSSSSSSSSSPIVGNSSYYYGSSHGKKRNGVPISPVLNVPHGFMPKGSCGGGGGGSGFFGLGRFLSSGGGRRKEKNSSRKQQGMLPIRLSPPASS